MLEGVGYRRSVSAAPPQYTSRMERSTKRRRVTLPDSPWTVPAGAVTCGVWSFSAAPCKHERSRASVSWFPATWRRAGHRGGWPWVGVDLLRTEQAVDTDAVCCRLVPDAGAPAVTRHPHRGAEPVGAGAPQIDGQLQFEGIAGDVCHVALGVGDDSQFPLPVERTLEGFDLRRRALDELVALQLQDPRMLYAPIQ